jgi:hypothetical protein
MENIIVILLITMKNKTQLLTALVHWHSWRDIIKIDFVIIDINIREERNIRFHNQIGLFIDKM